MRDDMAKVVTERPRRGHGDPSKKWGRRLNQNEYDLEDDGASRAPIARRRQYGSNWKEFSDLLGPLRRYLRAQVPGLENAGQSNLKIVHVSPAGDALSWPALDADVHVLGLVERVLGNRLFTEENGRRRGRRASKAKASDANQG